MTVNVKTYEYRHFDTMLIVVTEDDNVLYIYCPPYDCVHNNKHTAFYCYSNSRLLPSIESISYTPGPTKYIMCDGVARYINYGSGAIHTHTPLPGIDYWKYYVQNKDNIGKDIEVRQWSSVGAAFSNMFKRF